MRPSNKNWNPISENPPKFGWYLVFAKSQDPDLPFRHMSFWTGTEWKGLADVWQKSITHWSDWPEDPQETPNP